MKGLKYEGGGLFFRQRKLVTTAQRSENVGFVNEVEEELIYLENKELQKNAGSQKRQIGHIEL